MTEENKQPQEEKLDQTDHQNEDAETTSAATENESGSSVKAEDTAADEKDSETIVAEKSTEEDVDSEEAPEPVAHDDFDWSIQKSQLHAYKPEEYEQMLAEYDSTFSDISENEDRKSTRLNSSHVASSYA